MTGARPRGGVGGYVLADVPPRRTRSIRRPNVTTVNGAGHWPAFRMLGSTLRGGTSWPASGEVDVQRFHRLGGRLNVDHVAVYGKPAV